MPSQVYLLTTFTKMHVGSDTARGVFGAIDKTIQRDPATDYPYIASKSLRGALKEHFKEYGELLAELPLIFGTEKGTGGVLHLDSAYLLSLPVRSNKIPYANVSCQRNLDKLRSTLDYWGISWEVPTFAFEGIGVHFAATQEPIVLENKRIVVPQAPNRECATTVTNWLGSNLALVSNEYTHSNLKGYPPDLFGVLCDDFHLCVESHNALLNGVSQNLWYEQVLLPDTRFFFVVNYPSSQQALFQKFEVALLKPRPLQIGAHATSGYGYCKIEKLPQPQPATP